MVDPSKELMHDIRSTSQRQHDDGQLHVNGQQNLAGQHRTNRALGLQHMYCDGLATMTHAGKTAAEWLHRTEQLMGC